MGALLAGLTMVGFSGSPTASADGALPADQVVFMVDSGGGLVPPVVYALESPSLVMYGDGRILSIVRDDNTGGAVPSRYQLTRVDPLDVAAFVSSVEARGIINSDMDFGQPPVTDMDGTTVMVHGENARATVSVYAFHAQFDNEVTADQQKARAALRQVVDAAYNLAAGATLDPVLTGPRRRLRRGTGLRRQARHHGVAGPAARKLPAAEQPEPFGGVRPVERRAGHHRVQRGADQPRCAVAGGRRRPGAGGESASDRRVLPMKRYSIPGRQ